ncbi:MAG: AAA family ATPase [Dehalococcoidia bacterium]
MVTELMGGGDVEGVVEEAEDHRLPLEQAVDIAKETCRGLEFAHSRGIVHRDLKPGNVWLTGDGVAKIGDFGLAVAIDRSRLTSEGMMVGTVSYMPPEQAMGGEVTPRADLYSLGAMLYEMVTGRPPFLGDDSVAIIGQHINTPPVAPTWHSPECPRPLEALILRLLAKDPAERPQSATDVLSALDAVDLTGSAETSQPLDEAHALDSLAGGVFVGRQREMGELKAALEDALSGRGRLVTLVGEPGIGKTRTALELATYAGLRQAQVLWGRCYEEQGMPPYWPWVQAIRSYVRERDPEQIRSEMGSGAAAISEVVSEVRDRLPGLEAAPDIDPEQARFRLFDSITAFLKSASQGQPIVLMLDDLHWADKPSLQLLEFVSRELSGARLLLVGTYRDVELNRQHPLAETLGELTRERLFQRVLLRGLSQQDVGRFIEVAAGITPPEAMVETIHQQTEGNPLFLTEVVRLLVQEGQLTQELVSQRDSWSVRIPEGVREVIGRRLNRLSQRCNETLNIASVVGREFEMRQLAPLVEDMSEDRLLDVLEEALAARVIEELPQAIGRCQFTHALIQETLAGELTMTRRVRLHARIAEAMEGYYGANAEAHAAELAYHYSQAEAVLGPEKLVHYTQLAGEQALSRYAFADALIHFERALATKEGEPVDAEAAALLFGFGKAQAATLERVQVRTAIETVTRAFDYYVEAGNIEQAVAVAEYPININAALLSASEPLTSRALALVPPNSRQAGYLLSRQISGLGRIRANFEDAQAAFDQAMRIARQEQDLVLETRTLVNTANAGYFHHRYQDGLDKCQQAIKLATQVNEPHTEAFARYTACENLLGLGKLDEARTYGIAAQEIAEKVSNRDLLDSTLTALGRIACLKGEFQTTREHNDRVETTSPRHLALILNAVSLEYENGDFRQGEAYFQRLLDLAEDYLSGPSAVTAAPAFLIPLIARTTGAPDHFELARTAAESMLSTPNANPLTISFARFGLGLMAVLEDEPGVAQEQYTALEPLRGTIPTWGMVADRLLGLLAHTMGDLDQAVADFEHSLTFCRSDGAKPELAWTCCDYADTLLQRASAGSAQARPADREKAMSLLDESLAISTELGMRPLMERVLSRRDILKA